MKTQRVSNLVLQSGPSLGDLFGMVQIEMEWTMVVWSIPLPQYASRLPVDHVFTFIKDIDVL